MMVTKLLIGELLGKSLREIDELSVDEFTYWAALISIRNEAKNGK